MATKITVIYDAYLTPEGRLFGENSITPAKRDADGKVVMENGKIVLEEDSKKTSRKEILKAFLTKKEAIEAFNSDDDLEFEAEVNSARAVAARASSSNVSKEEMSTMNLEGAAV